MLVDSGGHMQQKGVTPRHGKVDPDTVVAVTKGKHAAGELRSVGDGEGPQALKKAGEANLEVKLVDGAKESGECLQLQSGGISRSGDRS